MSLSFRAGIPVRPRLDLDSYLSWMRRHNNLILHLGCYSPGRGSDRGRTAVAARRRDRGETMSQGDKLPPAEPWFVREIKERMSQGDSSEQRDVIAPDELDRIRNYLAQWPLTVGTNTPEGVPLSQQLLAYADALREQLAAAEQERDTLRAVERVIHKHRKRAEVAEKRLAAAESTARIEAQLANEEHERAEVAVGRLEKAQAALIRAAFVARKLLAACSDETFEGAIGPEGQKEEGDYRVARISQEIDGWEELGDALGNVTPEQP